MAAVLSVLQAKREGREESKRKPVVSLLVACLSNHIEDEVAANGVVAGKAIVPVKASTWTVLYAQTQTRAHAHAYARRHVVGRQLANAVDKTTRVTANPLPSKQLAALDFTQE